MKRIRTKHGTQRFGDYHLILRTRRRRHTLGRVVDGAFAPSPFGEFVAESISTMIRVSPGLTLYEDALMPHHVHLALGLAGIGPTMGDWVNAMESRATRLARAAGVWTSSESPWAEGMWCERIATPRYMRNVCAYIRNNPRRWSERRFK